MLLSLWQGGHKLANQTECFLDLVFRTVPVPRGQRVTPLLGPGTRCRRYPLREVPGDLGTSSCRYGKITQQRCEGSGGNQRGIARRKEKVDSGDEFSVDQRLEIFDGSAIAGIDDADYT